MPSVFKGLVPRDVMRALAHAGAYSPIGAPPMPTISRGLGPLGAPGMPTMSRGSMSPIGAPPMPTISAGDVAAAVMGGATWAPHGHHGHMHGATHSATWHPYTGVVHAGQSDVANSAAASFDSMMSQGDANMSSSDWNAAILAYQAAGNQGATSTGPTIDAATNNASQSLTQAAWQMNGQLAAIDNTSTQQSDAQQAQTLCQQMSNLYHQAANLPPGPAPAPGPSGGGGNVTPTVQAAAQACLAALNADSNYCSSVAQSGSAVNNAVHAFKLAWNAANPSSAVPVGTGNYEVSVSAALSTALGGAAAPAGCGAHPAPGPAPTPPPHPAPAPPAPVPPAPVAMQAGLCGTWGWKCILGVIAAAVLGFFAMHAGKHPMILPAAR